MGRKGKYLWLSIDKYVDVGIQRKEKREAKEGTINGNQKQEWEED